MAMIIITLAIIMMMKIVMIMARTMILNKSNNYLMAVDEMVGSLQVPHALLRSPKTARSIGTLSVKIPMGLVDRSWNLGFGRIETVSIQKIWTTLSLACRSWDFLLGDFGRLDALCVNLISIFCPIYIARVFRIRSCICFS